MGNTTSANYLVLAPGDSISQSFDAYCQDLRPGCYHVTAHYQDRMRDAPMAPSDFAVLLVQRQDLVEHNRG